MRLECWKIILFTCLLSFIWCYHFLDDGWCLPLNSLAKWLKIHTCNTETHPLNDLSSEHKSVHSEMMQCIINCAIVTRSILDISYSLRALLITDIVTETHKILSNGSMYHHYHISQEYARHRYQLLTWCYKE